MANPFEKFLNFTKFALWQKKSVQVLGIDVGASSIKVVQLRKEHGRAVLETYGEIATGPYRQLAVGQAVVLTPDKLAEAVKDLFREANVTTASASFAIPLGSSLLVIIEIPRVSSNVLDKVVPIEARKYIPVPIGEVAIDWWPIPLQDMNPEGKNPDKLEILVAAIHKGVISQYQDLATRISVVPSFFEIETFSSIRSVFSGDMTPTAILDIGAGSTKMAILDYGIVHVSHTIHKGSQDITVALSRELNVDFAKAEEVKRTVGLSERLVGGGVSSTINNLMEYIFAEANRVILDYQVKQKKTIGRIILIGGGSLLQGLIDVATKNFEIPVVIGKPFNKVESPPFLEPVLNEAGPGFAVAIGLALRHLQNLD
ncbi:type IV pilus assembly protein PilM [Candidatus Nomurabacteria bacterium]|nr:type IV pilus assembly protein PilM [Candidatus Nomurabacteria bacterium]